MRRKLLVAVAVVAMATILQRFLDAWQTGKATDLQAGLAQTAKQIDDAVAQTTGS
jgi:ribosomal protein S20